jgi:TIR domain
MNTSQHKSNPGPHDRRSIFISYRRADSAGYTGRIYAFLRDNFGKDHVVQDLESIPPGVEFEQFISNALRRCGAIVVVIGSRWASIRRGRIRRIDSPDDLVRRELLLAIEHQIPILPVLVGGAVMPKSDQLPAELRVLLRWNALTLHDDDFEHDLAKLAAALGGLLGHPELALRTVQNLAAGSGNGVVVPIHGWRRFFLTLFEPRAWMIVVAAGVVNFLLGLEVLFAVGISTSVLLGWLLIAYIVRGPSNHLQMRSQSGQTSATPAPQSQNPAP